MRRLFLFALPLILLAACTSDPAVETTTTEATTTTEPGPTTTHPVVRNCPEAPYEFGFLPLGIGGEFSPSDLDPEDVWTSVGGTHSTLIGRSDGTIAIALIRGTLPAVDWPGDKGVVQIDGVDAAVGPHPDGTWVAGWAPEPQERCDLYTMVFYPPWNPTDVEQVLSEMERTAG